MSLALVDPPATVTNPAQTSFAKTGYATSRDGTRIHYYTVGEGGPALVCCDGLGCDGYVWKYVAEHLSPHHQVIRWHYRGHGQSEKPKEEGRIHIEALCEDLEAVMDAHGLEKAVLLGHSLGVQTIFEFHKRHPSRVLGLVPMCGSYGRVVDTFHDSRIARHALPFVLKAVRAFPSVIQKAWSALDSELAYQVAIRTDVNGDLVKREDFRPYLSHLGAIDVRTFFSLVEDAAQNDSLLHLQNIDVPTLIVAGERDGFTPFWLSAVMHARIRASELCPVPAGTHTAPIEMPELVTLRLRRFLEERVIPSLAPSTEKRTG